MRRIAVLSVAITIVAALAACGSDEGLGTPVADRATTSIDRSAPTTEATTTTEATEADAAGCYVGTYRMQPVASENFTTRSGGGDATLTVAADGTFTIDLSTMSPWVAAPAVDPTMENHVQFGGTVTGSLVLPEDADGAATIDQWDPSGVTGQASSYLNGQLVMTMDADTANAIAQAAFGNPEGTWTVTPCEASGFAFSNSGVTFAWVRA